MNSNLASHRLASSNKLFIVSIALIVQCNLFIDAGLIQIYHKYKPTSTADELKSISDLLSPNNSAHQTAADSENLISSSTLEDVLNNAGSSDAGTATTAVEFASPMKRIMELISGHSPVFVVSNSDDQTSLTQQQQHLSPAEYGAAQQVASLNQQQVANPTSDTRQHWTLIDPSQMLAGQQLIQSTSGLPFEQYYIAAPASSSAVAATSHQNQPQFATVLPANLGFSPAATYQQIASYPPSYQQFITDAQQQQGSALFQQQQQPQPISSSTEDRTQPIFLSSYVPEVPAQQAKTANASPQLTQTTTTAAASAGLTASNDQQRPNSIQQIQQAQEKSATANDSSAAGDDGENSNDISDSKQSSAADEPDDLVNNGNDIEEPSKIKRSHASRPDRDDSQQSGDGDDKPDVGSSSYENKFDSDKDEQPRASFKSKSSTNRDQQASGTITNGLINVGLNDDCMQCICRASSGCDDQLRCITRGSEEKYCGPFQLTEEYWNMAGSPNDASNNFNSFEDCANDIDCAVETVTNYMKKYHKDCDGDENITCMDYARLHKLKPNECDNMNKLANNFDAYWDKFQRCAEGYNRTRNGDDEDF